MFFLKQFFILRYNISKNRLFDLTHESKLKIFFIVFFILSYTSVSIFLLFKGFHFILSFPVLGKLLLNRLFFIYFFFLFIMLSFSSLILSISSLKNAKEIPFLLIQPIEIWQIFIIKFFDIFVMANWAFVFMSFPVFSAYALVHNYNLFFYLLSCFIIIIPFICLCSAVGFILSILVIELLSLKKLKYIIHLILFYVLYKLFFFWKSSKNLISKDYAKMINTVLSHTSWSNSELLPSTWLSKIFLNIKNSFFDAICNKYLFFIFSALILLLVIIIILNNSFVKNSWQKASFLDVRVVKPSLIYSKCFSLFMIFPVIRKDLKAIILKDFISFFRDITQFFQFFIFFGLLGLYFYNLKNMHYNFDLPFWNNLIAYINLSSIHLILSTLFTRFIFPQISLEGNAIWILSLCPIRKKHIILTKFCYSLCLALFISISLIILSNAIIKVSGFTYIITIILTIMISITLSSFAVGFGAIFPNYKATDSVTIVSGFGGTLNLIVSILFVLYIVISHGLISHLGVIDRISKADVILYQKIVLLFNFGLVFFLVKVILSKAVNSIENIDF